MLLLDFCSSLKRLQKSVSLGSGTNHPHTQPGKAG
jgi:hypothetical protein